VKRPLAFLLSLLCAPVLAEEGTSPSPKVEPHLFVEGYQSFNFTNSAKQSGEMNPGLQYGSRDGQPSLGLVEAGLTVSQGEGEAHASFLFGPGAEYLLGSSSAPEGALFEATASYKPGDWTFTFGRRVTHMGYEAVRTDENWNLSKSILFQTAPTLHTGLSASYSPEEAFSVTGYYYDGWDGITGYSPSAQGKALGLKVEWSPLSALSLTASGLAGAVATGDPTDLLARSLWELYATLEASDALSLALHTEVGSVLGPSNLYGGVALYGRFTFAEGWALTLRLEEVLDEANLFELYDADPSFPRVEAREVTLTFEHRLTGNLLARLEGRFDQVLSNGTPVTVFANGLSGEQVTLTAGVLFHL